ncbi:MAG: 16S rRNA (guanine(966)-N(2))-methyltransferase RsmD [Desulfopila sp.]
MRIISGKARGRRLTSPPGRTQDIRPTSDRAREALFSILGSVVTDSRVLDLYAGTGALGLEAFSRGAAEVIFVDMCRQALALIQRNIATCTVAGDSSRLVVWRYDLRKGLPPALTAQDATNAFDLIFLDPPYSQGLSLKTLQYLSDGRIVGDNGLIVAEERSSESLPERCGVLDLHDHRVYGDSGFWFYRCSQPSSAFCKERQ